VTEDRRDEAERAGYTVIDPPSIIATHLTEIIKSHAAEILGRQDTQRIIDDIKKDYPAVVEDAQKSLSLGEIQKTLQAMLREQVSIRNMVTILEALADFAPISKDIQFLTEKARQALGRQICLQYADEDRKLRVLTIDHNFEQKIVDSAVQTASGKVCALEPSLHVSWIKALSSATASVLAQGWSPPIILCSEQARFLVKQSAERELPELVVLSVREITNDIDVEQLGEIRVDAA
ncbi:MAG: flagellar biosynthesis protein FlhA, partial [Spirochaetaceae bacterium]|jgi:flagellar biosynthesis protein FlhA|nr:flagellar biosynthesis protein FlhA [Spirochaetaceae bacterium]